MLCRLCRAFDGLDRNCLWFKLLCTGVKGRMYHAVKSLYENVKCCVKLNDGNMFTNTFPVTLGVKQGCKISPTLFNIYVNDLITQIKNLGKGVKLGDQRVSVLMYADDIILLSDSASNLQAQLDCVNNWCFKWKMEINENKTTVIHFRKKSVQVTNSRFKCGTKSINIAADYKYLGLWFNEHLDMMHAAREIAKSATRALGSIIVKFKALGGISYNCFKKLYESSVEPILKYAAGVWGTKEYKVINTVQNKAARFILGVQQKTPNLATVGDLGWCSILGKQWLEVVRLWLRLKSMDNTRLTARVFKHNLAKATTCRKKNWEYTVVELFNKIDIGYVVNIGDLDTYQHVIDDCKARFHTIDQNLWYTRLWNDDGQENGNKLRTYRQFKSEVKLEPYVTLNMPWYKKRVFSMLRGGCLPLEVEKGRYKRPKTPLNERTCKMCLSNCVEDENHFIMNCPLYEDLREDLFQHYRCKFDSFNDLCSNDRFNLIMKTGDYLTLKTIFSMYTRRCMFV